MHPVHTNGLLASQDPPQLATHCTHFPLEDKTNPKLHWEQLVELQLKQPVGQRFFASTQVVEFKIYPILHAVHTLGDEHVVQFWGHETHEPEEIILSGGHEIQVYLSEREQDKQPSLHFKQTVEFSTNLSSHYKQVYRF